MCKRKWDTFCIGGDNTKRVPVNLKPGDPIGYLPVFDSFEDALKWSEGDFEIVEIRSKIEEASGVERT